MYDQIITNMDDAIDALNQEIKQASISINHPSDIRVCAIFDGQVDACAAQQIRSRYICVNRPNTEDQYGFDCP